MTKAGEIIDKGLMTGLEDDILLLDPNPQDVTLQEVPIAGRTIIIIEVTSPEVAAHPDPLLGGPELHIGHQVETMTDA